ncbi:MAG: hypothetical protein HYX65_07370 [Gemmatimonadetes bacterium]|nr:hypothetical protein [Gemmatimonadota bacterium]
MSEHAHNPADQGGALSGFFGGAVVLLIIVVVIVYFTNAKFAGHEGAERPAAEATK